MSRRRAIGRPLPWAAVFLALSCGNPTGVDRAPTPEVAAVSIDPNTTTVTVGAQVPLHVVVTNENGITTNDASVVWSVRDPDIASVSATGVVTGRVPGVTQVAASAAGKSAIAAVTVQPPPASILVQPDTASLVVGQSTTLAAIVSDAGGSRLTNRVVTWTSSNVTVAAVADNGVVTAIAPGSATITAACEGRAASATITVAPPPVGGVAIEPTSVTLMRGQTTTLTPTVRDAAGTVTDRPVTWSSSNTLVATVSPAGVVTAVAVGTATISATSEGKSGSTTVTVTLVPVGSIAIQPGSASLTVGQTTPFTSIVKDANGTVVTDRVVTWTSSSPLVASVSTSGVVTALAPGSTTLTAASGGQSASVPVTVSRAPVGSVAVLPLSSSIAIGQTTTLAATVTDVRGVVVTDRVVAWSSSNEQVATVSATGVVSGVSVGAATITATSEGIRGSANVTVAAIPVATVSVQPTTSHLFVGQTAVLSATVTDANGTVVADRPVTWTSSNTLVATVSPTGVLTAVAPGSASITASAGGKSGSAAVVVVLVPVGSVVVAPSSATVIAGQTTSLQATVRDANGAVVTDRPVAWTSSNTLVATVSGNGVVSAVAPGSATITATSEGTSGNATVTVVPVPVGSVTVTPATKTVVVGATSTFVATVRDANGTIVTNRVVTWSSSNDLVARVSTAGVVTAVSVGTATITATSEGKTGSGAITVVPVPVGSVAVLPTTAGLQVGQSTTLAVTVKDANGTVVTDRVVTWLSSNPLAATVSASGVVTAVAPGTATITASSEGVSGSAAVTVTLVPVGSVTLPAIATLVAGASLTLVPTVKDANGVVVTDRTVTWSSSNPLIATVSSTGVVKAIATGTVGITATSETKSASTTVSVTPAPVGSVSVVPGTSAKASGQTVQLTATVRDTTGAIVTDRTVTWTSSNPLVATVSSAGLVTTLATGTATITATSETKSGSSAITVTPGPAASVTVSPATVSVVVNQTTQLTASAVDANGNPITGRAFTWTTSDNHFATVSPSGLVKGVRTGTVTITATLDGKSDTSTVTVTP